MPGDHQVRTRLDPLAPRHLDAVCLEVFEELEPHHLLAPFRVVGNPLGVALDGTHDFSSHAMHCHNCVRRQLSTGPTLSYHSAITPVIVCPGQAQGIALPPESIMPQDGHDTQDGARAAGTRWRAKHAERVAPHGVPVLGDDLSSTQPFCALALQQGFNFLFPCKPDSHVPLYERVALWQATDAMAERAVRHWNGRFPEVTIVRYLTNVFLRSGDEALAVHWLEITVVNAKTGEQRYHNSGITNHRLTADNGGAVAQASRGRWKIAHENTNVLKTKGYHLEQNFGHGTQYLAAFLLSLNLRAFLFHTVLEWREATYALLRRVLARRQTFFQDIQAFMRYMVFDDWDHIMDFMLRGLELESPSDTS